MTPVKFAAGITLPKGAVGEGKVTLQTGQRVQFPSGVTVGDGISWIDVPFSPAAVVTLPVMLPVKLSVGKGVIPSAVVAGRAEDEMLAKDVADTSPAVAFGNEGMKELT